MNGKLINNAASLAEALDCDRHCQPASRIVRDGWHSGTLFTWVDDLWVVYDLENRACLGEHDRLAVVSLEVPEADADAGLNQCCLGCDLECGEWVIDAEDLPDLRETYGAALVVLWEQDEATN